MGTLRQSGQSSCGDMTGISQYGPPPCRRRPRGARSRERAIRRCGATAATNFGRSMCRHVPFVTSRPFALWTVPNHAGAQSPSTAAPEVLRVTRSADDGGEGSLRWAIERNNAAPGRSRIELDPAGQPPHVIKLASPLPAIKGPVAIEGAPWKRSGEFVGLDGSGYIEDKGPQTCPGAVAGQYGANVRTTSYPGLALVDTQGVEISGLEIRNFCIGVLIHRASGNSLHDNRIVGNRGGAGVMLTGDDGTAIPPPPPRCTTRCSATN